MNISTYLSLIQNFLQKEITVAQFEEKYMELFKADPCVSPRLIYEVLNELFLDVEAYCPDQSLRNKYSIDENVLRERTEIAYRKLKLLIPEN